MTIEFHCPYCDRYLKTNDDKAGRVADCPGCGEKITVPDVSDDEYRQVEHEFGEEFYVGEVEVLEPANRLCPMCGAEISAAAAICRHCGEEFRRAGGRTGQLEPTELDLGEVMSTSWEIYKANLGPCVGAALIVMLLAGGFSKALSNLIDRQFDQMGPAPDLGLVFVAIAGQIIIQTIFRTWLTLGQTMFVLNIVRGETSSIGQVFSGGRLLPAGAAVQLLYLLMLMVGFATFILPGIIVGLIFCMNLYVIADRETGPLKALDASLEMTRGNRLALLALFLVTFVLYVAGFIACFVGVFFAAGYVSVMWVVAYMRMTGQPIQGY